MNDVVAYLRSLLRDATAPELPELDILAVIERMSAGGLDSLTRAKVTAAGGEAADAYHVALPWSQLARRDMTAAGVSGSNNLVGLTNTPVVDALAGVSALVSAGARVVTGLQGNVQIPRVSAAATSVWLAGESSTITESQPSLGAVTMTPKTAGALVQFSLLLAKQSPDLDRALRAELLRVVGALVDAGALDGSGSSGQPLGVLRTPGIGSASGTSITYATILGMLEDVRDAGGSESSTGWLMSPDVFTLLAARAKVTSGATIVDDNGTIAGKRVTVSAAVPAATLICADWSTVWLGTWGVGPELAIDPYGGFTSLLATMRCMLSVDVAVTAPSAVVVAASIT